MASYSFQKLDMISRTQIRVNASYFSLNEKAGSLVK